MTNEQIIRALECCASIQHYESNRCEKCSLREDHVCLDTLMESVLDLVARQKAEIERLDELNDRLGNDVDVKLKLIYELEDKSANVKSEAIKEFADKLIVKLDNEALTEFEMYDGYDIRDTKFIIANLVKEMTEGKDNNASHKM